MHPWEDFAECFAHYLHITDTIDTVREAGLVELLAGDGYRLTPLGRELMENFLPLHHFAERWSKRTAS